MSNKQGHPESTPDSENLSQETAEQESERDAEREALPKGAVAHSGTGTIKVTG